MVQTKFDKYLYEMDKELTRLKVNYTEAPKILSRRHECDVDESDWDEEYDAEQAAQILSLNDTAWKEHCQKRADAQL